MEGSINTCSLKQILRDALDRRREDDECKAGLHPDQDDHQEEVVLRLEQGCPGLGWDTEVGDDGVEQPNLGLIWWCVVVDKTPDHPGTNERDRHRHEDERLGECFKAAAIGKNGDQKPKDDTARGADQHPEEGIVTERCEHGALGEDRDIVAQTNKRG
jgi:hypothetical protein